MKIASIIYGVILSLYAIGQAPRIFTNNINSWYSYNGEHKYSKNWGVHLESQLRRSDIILKPQQFLARVGLNYHMNNSAFLTLGYCFIETYPYGAFAAKSIFPENRIYEQVQLKNLIGKIENVNRYRLEQRFVNSPVLKNGSYHAGTAIYTNRFRFMTKFSVPIKGNEIADKSFYFTLTEEIFINFGKNIGFNIFDQNRGFLGFGYKIPKIGRLEIGYLNQLLFKSDGIKVENNHTVQISLSSTINFFNTKP